MIRFENERIAKWKKIPNIIDKLIAHNVEEETKNNIRMTTKGARFFSFLFC